MLFIIAFFAQLAISQTTLTTEAKPTNSGATTDFIQQADEGKVLGTYLIESRNIQTDALFDSSQESKSNNTLNVLNIRHQYGLSSQVAVDLNIRYGGQTDTFRSTSEFSNNDESLSRSGLANPTLGILYSPIKESSLLQLQLGAAYRFSFEDSISATQQAEGNLDFGAPGLILSMNSSLQTAYVQPYFDLSVDTDLERRVENFQGTIYNDTEQTTILGEIGIHAKLSEPVRILAGIGQRQITNKNLGANDSTNHFNSLTLGANVRLANTLLLTTRLRGYDLTELKKRWSDNGIEYRELSWNEAQLGMQYFY